MLKSWKEYPLPTPYYHFFLQMKKILSKNKKPSHTALKNSLRLGKLAFVLCFVRFLSQGKHVTLQFNQTKCKTQTYIHMKKEKAKDQDKSSKTNTNPYIPYYFPTLSIHLV